MIYFIRREDTGAIKIGFSDAVAERLRAIRRITGTGVTLLATCEGSFSEERTLHAMFAHAAIGREWFAPTSLLIDLIAALGTDLVDSDTTEHFRLSRTLSAKIDRWEKKMGESRGVAIRAMLRAAPEPT